MPTSDAVVLLPVPVENSSAGPAASLHGTVPDGAASLRGFNALPGASSGGLAYGALRRLFDYYLSTVGELPVEGIAQQIRSELDKSLAPEQAEAAKRLLLRYMDFKRELFALEQQFAKQAAGPHSLRQRFEGMQALRARFFNAEEEHAMFGLEDAADLDALARLEIANNPALDSVQKKAQLAAVDAAMPPALRADRDAPRALIHLEEKAQTLRAQGGSEDDVYRLRAQALDASAAARLAEVDREELAWKARIDRYVAERTQVLKTLENAPASERAAALERIQQDQFSELERKRLVAYEP
ncbi:lipase secretion chaperone [Rhodoferax sp.]|uniref:lipase secretion chaperone n=1 Tax=Rhodoferax sp. TaxID=50421 RepID=UPI002ACE82E0|nr:lipase secretion chaperone [Rhodoferax sp.]